MRWMTWPGGYCSPRQRVPSNSTDEASKCVVPGGYCSPRHRVPFPSQDTRVQVRWILDDVLWAYPPGPTAFAAAPAADAADAQRSVKSAVGRRPTGDLGRVVMLSWTLEVPTVCAVSHDASRYILALAFCADLVGGHTFDPPRPPPATKPPPPPRPHHVHTCTPPPDLLHSFRNPPLAPHPPSISRGAPRARNDTCHPRRSPPRGRDNLRVGPPVPRSLTRYH